MLLVSISVTPAFAHNVQAVFIFGDSLFDHAGNNHYNNNCSAQADFPPYGSTYFHHPTGRFTNGRTVADFISQFLGIGIQKPFLEARQEVINGSRKEYPSNGVNFPSAGSGLYRATNSDLGVTPIQDQLQQFQTLMDQNLVDRKQLEKSLFFFESGSNDVFNYFLRK
ncbi:GDSL esterase/lipase 6 [Heracleum sosnowskyi]|uniref:GDSL esterase/lipase 6 n=1 Tax=Heracleum sosnowskyi TaxID=360622 RepID=A0AAD8HNR9_9APIA|nr:GDSL esterase/lipase 6 [Heracleum sosnowskyi]